MRLCMLNPFFYPYAGGTEKVIHEVGKRLADRHEIHVLTSRLPGTPAHEVIDGMAIHRTPSAVLWHLPPPLPPPYPLSPLHLADLWKLRDCDAFHIHNRFCYQAGTLLMVKRAMRNKRLFLTLHNSRVRGITPATDFLGGLYDESFGEAIMDDADAITAVSRYTLEATVPEGMRKKSRVIYDGIDTSFFTPEVDGSGVRKKFGVKAGERLLVCAARLVPQKGHRYLLQALAKLPKDTKLLCIGRGPLEGELRSLAAKLGVGERVMFTTGIPEPQFPAYYAAADVFVFPTLWEPFGVALCEAMSTGRPIVASGVDGVPEVVGDAGLLVPPRDPEALAGAIGRLLDSPKLCAQLGKKARERAVQHFDWDQIAEQYAKFYASFE